MDFRIFKEILNFNKKNRRCSNNFVIFLDILLFLIFILYNFIILENLDILEFLDTRRESFNNPALSNSSKYSVSDIFSRISHFIRG